MTTGIYYFPRPPDSIVRAAILYGFRFAQARPRVGSEFCYALTPVESTAFRWLLYRTPNESQGNVIPVTEDDWLQMLKRFDVFFESAPNAWPGSSEAEEVKHLELP